MKANKNSNFTKFVMNMGMSVSQEYNLVDGAMNACQYRRCVIKACISSLFVVALLSAVVAGALYAVFLMLINPIALFYFDTSLLPNAYERLVGGYALWGLATVVYLFILMIRTKHYVTYTLVNKPKKEIKNGFLRFLADSYRSFKDKFCPMVEYSDD